MMGGGGAARQGHVAGPSTGWLPPPPDTLRPPQAGMGGFRSASTSWAGKPSPAPVEVPQQPTPSPTRTTSVEAGPSAAAAAPPAAPSSSRPTSPADPTDPRAAARAAALRRFEALGSGSGMAPPGVGTPGRRVVTSPASSSVVDKGKGKAKASDIIAEAEEEQQEEGPAVASSTSLLSTSTALPTSSKLSLPSPSPSSLTREGNDNSQERRALVESQMRDLDDLGRRVWELQCELGRVWSAIETSGTMGAGGQAGEVTKKEITTPKQPSAVPGEGQGVAPGGDLPAEDEARPPSSPHASS